MQSQTLDSSYVKNITDDEERRHYFSLCDALAKEADPALLLHSLAITDRPPLTKPEHRRFDGYFYRYIDRVVNKFEDSSACYLRFHNNGTILDIFGGSNAVSRAAEDGIVKGTQWTLQNLGVNAVTVGQAHQIGVFSISSENDNNTLKKYAIYFRPIMIEDIHPPFTSRPYGGIACIADASKHSLDYLYLVSGIVNTMTMNTNFASTTYSLYGEIGKGILAVDKALVPGSLTITHQSNNLSKILATDLADMTLQPLTNLLDPPPDNREIWDLLQSLDQVNNKNILLSVQAKKIPCLISTRPYHQPNLNNEGQVFFIDTDIHMTSRISNRMGNNAVFSFDDMIGSSIQMLEARAAAVRMADSAANILLLGESGTGKDVFAQAIHNASNRRGRPFIAVNCGAIPRDLIASELFGYERGAFTGASNKGNLGKFELANGGTIFLDEIGELPLDLQATLLRVVEEKRLTRIGGDKTIDLDVKILSATNADIPLLVSQQRFRADLFYRLGSLRLNLPPLRERGSDLLLLANYFIEKTCNRIGRHPVMLLSEESKALMTTLPWHGNVRELQNVMDAIVQLYPDDMILPEHILNNLLFPVQNTPAVENDIPSTSSINKSFAEPHSVRFVPLTEESIKNAIRICGNNKTAAARHLGVSIRTLYRKMEKLGMPLN